MASSNSGVMPSPPRWFHFMPDDPTMIEQFLIPKIRGESIPTPHRILDTNVFTQEDPARLADSEGYSKMKPAIYFYTPTIARKPKLWKVDKNKAEISIINENSIIIGKKKRYTCTKSTVAEWYLDEFTATGEDSSMAIYKLYASSLKPHLPAATPTQNLPAVPPQPTAPRFAAPQQAGSLVPASQQNLTPPSNRFTTDHQRHNVSDFPREQSYVLMNPQQSEPSVQASQQNPTSLGISFPNHQQSNFSYFPGEQSYVLTNPQQSEPSVQASQVIVNYPPIPNSDLPAVPAQPTTPRDAAPFYGEQSQVAQEADFPIPASQQNPIPPSITFPLDHQQTNVSSILGEQSEVLMNQQQDVSSIQASQQNPIPLSITFPLNHQQTNVSSILGEQSEVLMNQQKDVSSILASQQNPNLLASQVIANYPTGLMEWIKEYIHEVVTQTLRQNNWQGQQQHQPSSAPALLAMDDATFHQYLREFLFPEEHMSQGQQLQNTRIPITSHSLQPSSPSLNWNERGQHGTEEQGTEVGDEEDIIHADQRASSGCSRKHFMNPAQEVLFLVSKV